MIPISRRERILAVLQRMDAAVSGFFHERLLIAVITGVMYALGWDLTDVPYWFLLGIGTGLLSLIPYVSVLDGPRPVVQILGFARRIGKRDRMGGDRGVAQCRLSHRSIHRELDPDSMDSTLVQRYECRHPIDRHVYRRSSGRIVWSYLRDSCGCLHQDCVRGICRAPMVAVGRSRMKDQ